MYVWVFHDFKLLRLCAVQFFVVRYCIRSNDSFNFPLGWIKYTVPVIHYIPFQSVTFRFSPRQSEPHSWKSPLFWNRTRGKAHCFQIGLVEKPIVLTHGKALSFFKSRTWKTVNAKTFTASTVRSTLRLQIDRSQSVSADYKTATGLFFSVGLKQLCWMIFPAPL